MGVFVDVRDRHGSKARLLREEVVLYPQQPHGEGDGAAAKSLVQGEGRVGDRGSRIMPRHLHASSVRVRAPQEPSVLDGYQEAGVYAGSLRTGPGLGYAEQELLLKDGLHPPRDGRYSGA